MMMTTTIIIIIIINVSVIVLFANVLFLMASECADYKKLPSKHYRNFRKK